MIEIKFTILSNGLEHWFFNRDTHREDGPAIISPTGSRFWFINGKPHREDGPAVINPDGSQDWFIDGIYQRKKKLNS